MIIGFLGKKLNQTRILFISILFFLSYYFLMNAGTKAISFTSIDGDSLRQIFAIALPLSLCFSVAFKERKLLYYRTFVKLVFALSPFIYLVYCYFKEPAMFNVIVEFTPVKYLLSLGLYLPEASLIACLGYFLSYFLLSDSKISHFSLATFIVLIPFMLSIQFGLNPNIQYEVLHANTVSCYTIISGILLHSMFRMYWFRVYIDELTGIPNRRALDEYTMFLDGEYTIAMVDIDHFKSFNDKYGHDEGDNVLRMVAKTLDTESKNKAYRYGGEEFCIVFERVNAEDASMYANKIRRALEERDFYIRSAAGKANRSKSRKSDLSKFSLDLKSIFKKKKKTAAKSQKKASAGKNVNVTISVGLANPDAVARDALAVIKKADKALYKAKDGGRNCVKVAPDSK
jgi:diguanylate cyclase (GGDEF)-like protein